MSAENAWRIAMEAAAKVADAERRRYEWDAKHEGNPSPDRLRAATASACAGFIRLSTQELPMPPAFRAEVEAEELRGMLAEASAFLLLAQWPSAHEGARAHDLVSRIDALSRLEAKGESHE